MINIFQPSLGEEELKAVKDVFKSNWIGKGPKTEEFEIKLADKIDVSVDNVTTTTCCTEGLFQIFEFLNLPTDSEVILPSISFIGAGNAVLNHGLKPVFCDVNVRTLNPEVKHIKKLINVNTKAIIIIHYGGLPCEMDELVNLCKENDLILIEDNACSPFSKYKGNNTGTLGDFGVWSFDSMKILVAGDCGLIYSNKDISPIKERCYLGLKTTSGVSSKIDKKWWEFDISYPGGRSIVNDITSAIGLEQLKKVDNFISKRKQIHEKYNEELKDLDWLKIPPKFPDHVESSYYMYWIQLDSESERDNLAKYLRKNDIYTTFRYYPLHLVDYYRDYSDNCECPNTEVIARTTLCLPLHQSLKFNDVSSIIKKIKEYKIGKKI